MEALTSYGYWANLFFILLACFTLIGESFALFWGPFLQGRQGGRRTLPELAALAVLLSVALLFGGFWNSLRLGFAHSTWLETERFFIGSFALLAGAFSWQSSLLLSLPLAAAGLLILPLADSALPWSAFLATLLLALRLIFLAFRERTLLHYEVTAASIREGLDLLPEGVLFARRQGAVVLVNIAMLRFMERLFQQQFRSFNAFWEALQEFDHPSLAEKKVQKDAFLFRFSSGDSWLVQRMQLTEGLEGWQMTASCVTELDAVTQELEAKNALLETRADEQKKLLKTLEKTERHRALLEITTRVHDILGQRISMLQQLLASPAPKDILDTIVHIDALLEAVPLGQEPPPEMLLADMLDTYRSLGVKLSLSGSLPRNMRRAQAFAAIIREALSNAVCHGRANEILIEISERRLRVRDNGLGCPHGLSPGGGLKGMMQRLDEIGGQLAVTTEPYFEIAAKVGEKRHDKNPSR